MVISWSGSINYFNYCVMQINDIKKNWKWYSISCFKLFISFAVIAYFEKSIFLGVMGVLSLALFTYEQLQKYKAIQQEKKFIAQQKNRNR